MNPVVHFEMPAEDKQRVKKFYEQAFGWQMQILGPEMNDYVLATTTPADDKGRPKDPGAINGGFYQKTAEYKEPSIVIAVDNLETSMELVTKAGGKILNQPMDIPGIGKFDSFIDTEGTRVGMLQPAEM